MNNNIDPDSISKNTDQSRVFDDNGNRVEKTDGNTKFSNNLTDYYNNINNNKIISEKTLTKDEKNEVVNGLFDKIKNSILLFFSTKKVKNDEEYIERCKNASKISIIFLLIVVLDFLLVKTAEFDFINFLVNVGCLVILGLAIVCLRSNKKNSVMFGLIGGLLMVLSFNIIRMIFGVIYIWGMLCLMNCKEEEKKTIDNNDNK